MQRVTGQTPPPKPKSNSDSKDETYLNLLSSQRRLFNQISTEGLMASLGAQRSPRGDRHTAIGGELTHNRMNSAISGPPSNELLYDKSSTGPDSLVDLVSAAPSCLLPSSERKQSGSDIDIDGYTKMKPIHFGLSLSFLDNTQSRPGSMASDQDTPLYDPDGRLDDEDDDDKDDRDNDDDDLSFIEPLDFKCDQVPALLVKELTGLDGAMAKSQDSQQRIHDWDKKMGLKRSHSKTMRLSSRSRKKVRVLIKRELSSISQQSKSDKPYEGGGGLKRA